MEPNLQTPPQPQYQETPYVPAKQPVRPLSIIGLVLAFIIPPAGLVIGIIVLAKRLAGANKVLGILSTVFGALNILTFGIVAALVLATFNGVQVRAQDTERQTDINALQKQLEAYYAQNGGYPSLSDLNDQDFRKGNGIMLDSHALADPSNPTAQELQGAQVQGKYSYAPVGDSADCTSPTSSDGTIRQEGDPCTSYTLSAYLESRSEYYTQKSLDYDDIYPDVNTQ